MPRRNKLQPLQVYRLLPRTNCGLCGCDGCFAFALALARREKTLEDCGGLGEEDPTPALARLRQVLATTRVFPGTGLAIEEARCNGCGDCVTVCRRAITTINPSAGIVGHRNWVPPVLQVVDGLLRVVNWDSCKRNLNPPDYCRVCEEKCPFGALELVR